MKLSVCVPTLKCYDLLDNFIHSCEKSTIVPDQYVIVDNGFNYVPRAYSEKIKIIIPENNTPWCVSKCWNYFMKNIEGIKILANDDIWFHPYTLSKIVEDVTTRSEDWFSLQKPDGTMLGFSCVIIKDSTYKEVGEFDETFYPAYYEDCDYLYRMNLLNKKEHHIICDFEHKHSATFKSFNQEEQNRHHTTFTKNQNYYKAKWGDLSPNERYRTPFNK